MDITPDRGIPERESVLFNLYVGHRGEGPQKWYEDIKTRSHKIWYFDIEGMLCEVEDEYERRRPVVGANVLELL